MTVRRRPPRLAEPVSVKDEDRLERVDDAVAARPSSPPYVLRVMGAFALTNAATGETVLPPRRKARALLAYLALSGEGSAARDRLSVLFWPDRAPEQARASLRQTIADLNRSTGGGARFVCATRDEVAVDRELLAIDRDQFVLAARSGDLAGVEQRLAAWDGRILGDLDGFGESFEDWIASLRRVTEVEIFDAALGAAEAGLRTADPRTIGLIALRLTTVDPYAERAARLGLAAGAAAGDLAAVHRLYRRFEALLREDLGTAPSAATQRLYATLIGDDAKQELQPPSLQAARRPSAALISSLGADPLTSKAGRPSRWLVVLAMAVVVIAAGGAWIMHREGRTRGSAPAPATLALYQAGRDAADQRTRLGVFRSVGLLQQVVRQAPSFSRGWSALAFADFLVWNNRSVASDLKLPESEWYGRSRSAAERALALDPKNGEAYMVLAMAAQAQGDTDAADTLIERGIAADPQEATLHRLRGGSLLGIGYARAALTDLTEAVRLAPADPRAASLLYSALLEAGYAGEARRLLADAYAKFPLYPHIWRQRLESLLGDHRYREAEAMVVPTALQPDRTFAGTPEQLRRIVRALASGRPADGVAGLDVPGAEDKTSEANFYLWRVAALGRIDQAFAAVEVRRRRTLAPNNHSALADDDDGFAFESFVSPLFDAFRRDPRFMNLWVLDGTAYRWQRSGRWPDFCQRPGWPYDCKLVAARYTAEDIEPPERL